MKHPSLLRAFRYYMILVGLLLQACGADSDAPTADPAPSPDATVAESEVARDVVSFECKPLADEDGMPMQQVSLVINGTAHIVDTINTCQAVTPDNYLQYNMPENTLAATYSWWAGYGEYLYAIRRDDSVMLMRGYSDEMEEEPGFNYEQVAKFGL